MIGTNPAVLELQIQKILLRSAGQVEHEGRSRAEGTDNEHRTKQMAKAFGNQNSVHSASLSAAPTPIITGLPWSRCIPHPVILFAERDAIPIHYPTRDRSFAGNGGIRVRIMSIGRDQQDAPRSVGTLPQLRARPRVPPLLACEEYDAFRRPAHRVIYLQQLFSSTYVWGMPFTIQRAIWMGKCLMRWGGKAMLVL